MNIVLLTNTFTPHVGGVARSVQAFVDEYRKLGHRVLVVAPEFADAKPDEQDVWRIPAIQNFNASDFSVALPIPTGLSEKLDEFEPDIVHAQHPFLLGMTALRIARQRKLPLVFTHHTLYEQYTHYVPGDSEAMKRFIIELATRYANLCNQVFAPSESIRDLLIERGVTTPISVVPTGVHIENFAHGDRAAFRDQQQLPEDAFVVGHLGRLAEEKNLGFLARSVAQFVQQHENAYFLVVGSGPAEAAIKETFAEAGLSDRLLLCGVLEAEALADALNAMDVFAFASKSETQGMVLAEAMAAGLPVVALDASGAREVVQDRENGRLLFEEDEQAFSEALDWIYALSDEQHAQLIKGARQTAQAFSMECSAEKALYCFERLTPDLPDNADETEKSWEQVMARIKAEWDIFKSLTKAGDEAISGD